MQVKSALTRKIFSFSKGYNPLIFFLFEFTVQALIIGLLLAGCEDTDIGIATQAGVKAVKVVALDNEELLFVVGHEMGHVVDDHIKKKIRLAYAGSAVRKAIASQRNEAGQIARSVLGALAQQVVNAQFSQQEEREADDFGLVFLQSQGMGEAPAVSAMMKLAFIGNDPSFLSSHPAPEARRHPAKLRNHPCWSGSSPGSRRSGPSGETNRRGRRPHFQEMVQEA